MSSESGGGFPGIHHVTAICGDPQQNVEFYSHLLGLRLVKKTVNFDDPGSYHLYYGDAQGTPGTILTFFAWTSLPEGAVAKGRVGMGQITTVAFSIPPASLDFWRERLRSAGVEFAGPEERFGEPVLVLRDPDGIHLELVAHRGGAAEAAWGEGPVPLAQAIQGIHSVTLSLPGYEHTAALLAEVMGLASVGAEGNRFRFQLGAGEKAGWVDLLVQAEGRPARMGIGTVHHVAWRVRTAEEQARWREVLSEAGCDVTPVLDRQYFQSVYYREPGGIIFEIATEGPGFATDERLEALGEHLKLPPWLEAHRDRIEARLPEIRTAGARR